MRRKIGSLVPLELDILETAIALARGGVPEAHGFLLARELRDRQEAKRLTAYGTLYKALERLEGMGFLESRWEDPQAAAEDGRPRRRFYRVTVVGERAAADARSQASSLDLQRSAAALRT
jgi:DNA-binding PadR family transcriptional regulator